MRIHDTSKRIKCELLTGDKLINDAYFIRDTVAKE